MTLEKNVYTMQLAQWRRCLNTPIVVVDITLGSGARAFAPTPELLKGYRSKEINEDEYKEIYVKLMEESKISNLPLWEEVLTHEEIALACYCSHKANFCHRYIFLDLLTDFAKTRGVNLIYKGEITKEFAYEKQDE